MSSKAAILWFRNDLRLGDNPALAAACACRLPLLCIYVFDEESTDLRPRGGASKWRLDLSLKALAAELAARGGELHILRGPAEIVVPALARAASGAPVFWSRRYGGAEIALDSRLKQSLREQGSEVASFNGALLAEPWEIVGKSGGAYRVFTPFWRALQEKLALPTPLPVPEKLVSANWPADAPPRLSREALGLAPRHPDWARDFPDCAPGEILAQIRLRDFLGRLNGYGTNRDRLDLEATSGLSAQLHFGELSPRQIFHAAQGHGDDAAKFLSEIGWREFSYQLLYAHPDLDRRNFNRRFDAFPWAQDEAGLKAWRRGRTGYPVVDAAMRQLWTTGLMHNRARMVTASFLTKHLLIDWREGESWFWDTLIDADEANNAASWQWVAGCGADAAPFFRIFNPVLQGEKFDPQGVYVKRFCPELAGLPARYVHRPWAAPPAVLAQSNVRLGLTYPAPIVDHDFARRRALAAFQSLGGSDDGALLAGGKRDR